MVSRFSDVFFIDATTVETINTGLKDIALAKRIGNSEQEALDWLSRMQSKWLLLFDNADDPKINLHPHFPTGSWGKIVITTRNHQICSYATTLQSSCQVSNLEPDEAQLLLLRAARIPEDHDRTEATSKAIVKVNHTHLMQPSL
jgi:hypothetical protein